MELKMLQITKDYKEVRAVNNISYTFTNGVYGLLGVNGAGKTTLMRILCTLLKPTSGSVLWDGKEIFAMDGEYRRLLGDLPQDFGFYPEFTVSDYLKYIASIKGLRPAAAKSKAELLLGQVGLQEVKNKKMKKLSGGMKRRAGIAQAMLNNPKILILDEPTAGLDPNERIRFRNLISELAQERIVVLSTHIVSDIEYIANEILLMKNGQIALSGTAEELVHSMPERVWSLEAPREMVDVYLKNYKVSNIKAVHGGAQIRVLAREKPAEHANLEVAALEDVFLYYFGEKVGEAETGYIGERRV